MSAERLFKCKLTEAVEAAAHEWHNVFHVDSDFRQKAASDRRKSR